MLQNQQHSSRSLQDPAPPQCKPRANHRSNPKAKQIAVISAGITVTIPNQSKQSCFCFFNALTDQAHRCFGSLTPYLAVESKPLQQGLTCPHSPPWCPRIWNHWRTLASVKVRWLMECSRHVQTFCWKCIVPHGFTPCYTSNQKFHSCSMTACPAAQQFPAELCSEIAIWGSNLPTCRALHSLTREWRL